MADVEENKCKLRSNPDFDAHQIPMSELLTRYETHESRGLPEQKSRENISKHGYNTLSSLPKSSGPINNTFKGFVVLLWIKAAIHLLSYLFSLTGELSNENLSYAISSFLVAFISSCFPWIIRLRASKARKLGKHPLQTANVIRDGRESEIRSEELTCGDIIQLKSGERVPADVRIMEADNFWVDNSMITGEGGPVERSHTCTHSNPLETQNLAFLSTYVIEGTAKGIVVSTGMNTVKGRTISLTNELKSGNGVFSQDLNNLFSIMIKLGIFVAVINFVAMFILGFHWLDSLVITLECFLAFLPQGLLLSMYLSLAIILRRLSTQNCLATNWETCATLGSTTVICTDKTGTLTQNRTKVAHLWLDGQIFGAQESEDANKYGDTNGWKIIERAIALDSLNKSEGQAQDAPTENTRTPFDALSMLLGPTQNHVANLKYQSRKIFERFYHSSIGVVVSVYEVNDEWVLIVKGDPKVVMDKCSTFTLEGNDFPIDSKMRSSILEDIHQVRELGEEVIGFCDFILDKSTPLGDSFDVNSLQGLRFIGFLSLHDPPRANVPDAISRCRSSGIKVIMTTGDSPTVSKGFAKNVGLITREVVESVSEHQGKDVARVIEGDAISELSEQQLGNIIWSSPEILFARVSPEQKALIVKACQGVGYTVAAIGEGVDDAVALRASNIGIALGSRGLELQSAADLILLDDNFASVVYGIEEGMLFFDNLSKVIVYSLSTKVPQMVFIVAFTFLDIPLPINGILILFIDFGINMLPAVSLINESPEYSLTHRHPRRPNQSRLVNKSTILHTHFNIGYFQLCVGLLGYLRVMTENGFFPDQLLGIAWTWNFHSNYDQMDSYGQEWDYFNRKTLEKAAQIAFFISIVFLQATNLILSKTARKSIFKHGMRNLYLNLSLVLVVVFGVLGAVTCGMGIEVQKMHLSVGFWIQNLVCALVFFLCEECRKWVFRSADAGDKSKS